MLRKALLIGLLPVVWLPIIGLTLAVAPALPWWSLVFGVAFLTLLARRLRGRGALVDVDPDGPRFSPIGGGGY